MEPVEVPNTFKPEPLSVHEVVCPGMGMEDDVKTRERLVEIEGGRCRLYFANSYIQFDLDKLNTIAKMEEGTRTMYRESSA